MCPPFEPVCYSGSGFEEDGLRIMVCTHGVNNVGRDESARLCIGSMRASVFANVAILLIKIYAWSTTGAISYLAGILEVLLDLLVALMNFGLMVVSRRPASAYYRFGYGKIEALGALVQSGIVLYGSVWLCLESWHGFESPQPIKEHFIGMSLIGVSTLVTLLLVFIQTRTLKKTTSLLVASDAVHARGHLLLNLGIFLALLTSYYGVWAFVDPLFGVAVGVYMFLGACRVGRQALRGLLDAEAPMLVRQRIEKIITEHSAVCGFHKLRTRYAGAELFVQGHVEMSGKMSLTESHRVAHEIEDAIIAAFPHAQVVLHQDPVEAKEGHVTEY